jgi:2-oxoglutarate dehydrogenase E2 component (dihydrolipoamide succinyltransferase)
VTLPRRQIAVASVVTRSHATIPPGFLVARVNLDGALAYGRAATRRLRTLIGLTELMVASIGRQRAEFADCFGASAPAANVGVSMDVGTGLYVPVVHHADRLPLDEIGALLTRYRRSAIHDTFRPADLAGATIMVTLSAGMAMFTRPIVYPDQVCAVSLGAPMAQPLWDHAHASARRRTVAYVGLAHDHRVLNGLRAGRFLTAIRTALQTMTEADVHLD